MTATDWLSLLVGAVLASFMVAIVVLVTRAVAYVRLHHPWANRRFKRRYRAEHPLSNRATVEAQLPPSALPVIRSRTPAGVDGRTPVHIVDSMAGLCRTDRAEFIEVLIQNGIAARSTKADIHNGQ